MVQIQKQIKRKVYEYLLTEGVLVQKKDNTLSKHSEIETPNLMVWMIMRSLKDRGLVELIFAWRHFYYILKPEGVAYLRDWLGITEDTIVPITYKQQRKLPTADDEQGQQGREGRWGQRGRGGYGRGQGRDMGRGEADYGAQPAHDDTGAQEEENVVAA